MLQRPRRLHRRVLWKRTLPGAGQLRRLLQRHVQRHAAEHGLQPEAHRGGQRRGTNFVATERGGVRRAWRAAATCSTRRPARRPRTIPMPRREARSRSRRCGASSASTTTCCLGGAGFANYTGGKRDLASREGLRLTRHVGQRRPGGLRPAHGQGAVAGEGPATASCTTGSSPAAAGSTASIGCRRVSKGGLQRRGVADRRKYRIVAFDARTGREVWQQTANIFGTWLSYSAGARPAVAGRRAEQRSAAR